MSCRDKMTKFTNDDQLDALAQLSVRIGADPCLTQGPGGNTSIKLGGRLWVKASGTWLADALKHPIFLSLDLADIRRRLDAGEADPARLAISTGRSGDLRPSIETTMHAVIRRRVVLHVHSVNTIAHAVRADGEKALSPLLQGLGWAWIPYAKPGVPLTHALRKAADDGADVLVPANHGLVVAANDVEKAASLLCEVETRLRVSPRQAPAAAQTVLQELIRVEDTGCPCSKRPTRLRPLRKTPRSRRAGRFIRTTSSFWVPLRLPLFRENRRRNKSWRSRVAARMARDL